MYFDLLLWRHFATTLRQGREFPPDVIHVTGPRGVGFLWGAISKAPGLYVVWGWGTNLHDFVASRVCHTPRAFLFPLDNFASGATRTAVLWSLLQFYQIPRVVVAPSREILSELEQRMGRSGYLLPHGVDTTLFDGRKRRSEDGIFRIGYVGRIVPEKNLRIF